jgi:hypothetical protein
VSDRAILKKIWSHAIATPKPCQTLTGAAIRDACDRRELRVTFFCEKINLLHRFKKKGEGDKSSNKITWYILLVTYSRLPYRRDISPLFQPRSYINFCKVSFICIKLTGFGRDIFRKTRNSLVNMNKLQGSAPISTALNQRLRELVQMAKSYPPKSPQQRHILGKLISEIQNSGLLCHPSCPFQYQGCYAEIYATALQNIFLYVCQHLELYNPDVGEVLGWVNFLLSRRFPDAIAEVVQSAKHIDFKNVKTVSIEDLSRGGIEMANKTDLLNPLLSEQIREILEEDPDGEFESKCMSSNPLANFKAIALKRLRGASWEELSLEYQSKIAALSNFYQRSLTHFAPKIQQYLSE